MGVGALEREGADARAAVPLATSLRSARHRHLAPDICGRDGVGDVGVDAAQVQDAGVEGVRERGGCANQASGSRGALGMSDARLERAESENARGSAQRREDTSHLDGITQRRPGACIRRVPDAGGGEVAAAQGALMTACCEGPLGAVSELERPSWLTADPANATARIARSRQHDDLAPSART